MATLADLRNVVARKIGLDNAASSTDQALIDEWVNQGVLEVLLRTHCTIEQATMDTTASTWLYQLPTSILHMKDLWREDAAGAVFPAVHDSYLEILNLHYATTAAADSNVIHYAVVGSNLLAIWPTASTVYTIKLLYVPRPTALSAAGDDPSSETLGRVPTEFHKAIEYYALWQAADYDDDASSDQGERYRAHFNDFVQAYARPAIHKKGGGRLSPALLNPPRKERLPRDPSASTW